MSPCVGIVGADIAPLAIVTKQLFHYVKIFYDNELDIGWKLVVM